MKIEATDEMILKLFKDNPLSLNIIIDPLERKNFIENNYEALFSFMCDYPTHSDEKKELELKNMKTLLDNSKIRESLYAQLENIRKIHLKKSKKNIEIKDGMLSYILRIANNKHSVDFYNFMEKNDSYKDYFYNLLFNNSIDLSSFTLYTYKDPKSQMHSYSMLESLCALSGEKSYSFLEEKVKKIGKTSCIYLLSTFLTNSSNRNTQFIVIDTIFKNYPELIFETSLKKDAWINGIEKSQFFNLLNIKIVKYSFWSLDTITKLIKSNENLFDQKKIDTLLDSIKKLCENIEKFDFDSTNQVKSIKNFLLTLLNTKIVEKNDLSIKKENNLLLKIIAEINSEVLDNTLSRKENNNTRKTKI